jgi:hypothetical protein
MMEANLEIAESSVVTPIVQDRSQWGSAVAKAVVLEWRELIDASGGEN